MKKYKVGDVAALFSKPKNPTTTGEKKLKSLFEDYYSKKDKSAFHSQLEEKKTNKNEKDAEINYQSESKKNKKRKFSCTDLEVGENISSKKFKESAEEKSFKQKKIKKQKDFPRKNKQSKGNSFNFVPTFPKFESENAFKNDAESLSAPTFKNVSNDNKQSKGFIKKSKKKSFDDNTDKILNDISFKDCNDSDEDALRKEINEFMQSSSTEKKLEANSNSFKQGKTLKKKEHNKIGKLEKNLTENTSSEKHDSSFEQNVASKKKNKKNNVQDFPRNKKKAKANLLNLDNSGSINKHNVEEDSSLKNLISVEQDNVKKSKKSKQELQNKYTDISTSENNSEVNVPKVKGIVDFIRKPKNKKDDTKFDKDNFNNLSNPAFDGRFDKNVEISSNKQQKGQVKKSNVESLDFIKLDNSIEVDKNSLDEQLSRTLFVGNLPTGILKSELKKFFSRFGPVRSVRLPGIETDKAKVFGKNPPKLLHPNYASDSIPAFIIFKDKAFAEEALKLSGSMFKGRHITVDFALQPGSHKLYDDKRSIFIGNLPFDVKDESIWNAFNQCGKIEGVRVVRDRQTGLGKGFGYVLFSTVEAKDNALSLESMKIEGREIRIKPVDSSKKTQNSDLTSTKRNSFKSRAIRMKKNNKGTSGHKSIRKLTNKQKILHKKKKTAAILQKVMK